MLFVLIFIALNIAKHSILDYKFRSTSLKIGQLLAISYSTQSQWLYRKEGNQHNERSFASASLLAYCYELPNQSLCRVHPFTLLIAWKTYEGGHGERGSLHWKPNPDIISALKTAFTLSFKVDFLQTTYSCFSCLLQISYPVYKHYSAYMMIF